MAREQRQTRSEGDPAEPGPRRQSRWWVAGLPASMLIAAAVAAGAGKPVALSFLDVLVLVALAVVAWTYLILARADRQEGKAERSRQNPAADEP